MSGSGSGYSVTPSNIPIPDPSEITSREIARAKGELREEFKGELDNLKASAHTTRTLDREVLETRLIGMDKALELLAQTASSVPSAVDRETGRLEKLFAEKFNATESKFAAVQIQLTERDVRSVSERRAAGIAVETALAALKELISLQNSANAAAAAKTDTSFTKEMDALKTFINATKDSTSAEIANLKSRIDRGEGGSVGQQKSQDNSRANASITIAGIGGAVAILALIVTIVLSMPSRQQVTQGSHPVAQAEMGNDTSRVDDLAQRLTALSGRINQLTSPRQSP